ncbi:hypothetical protein D3C77_816820 [compost metagenome]
MAQFTVHTEEAVEPVGRPDFCAHTVIGSAAIAIVTYGCIKPRIEAEISADHTCNIDIGKI